MADRYWVGGTGFWDGNTGAKWATTSGGAGGASIPTSVDDVFFDAASGAITCTISTGNTGAKSINCTGFTGTLAGTATMSLDGSLTLVAGMTLSFTGSFVLGGAGTVTSAGKILSNVTVSASSATVTLADPLTMGSDKVLTLNSGNLDLNGFTLSVGRFTSSITSSRSISFGSGNIELTSSTPSTTILAMTTANNFTWTGTGGFRRNMIASASVIFGTTGGSTTSAPNLTVYAGSSNLTIVGGSYFKNVNFTGYSGIVSGSYISSGNLTLGTSGTYSSLSPSLRGSATVTSNGKLLSLVSINGSGITVNLADNLQCTLINFLEGTFNSNNYDVNTQIFTLSGGASKIVNMGSGVWTISSTWNAGAATGGIALNANTSTINMTSASTQQFVGAGLTYYNLNQGGSGALIITGSNTFNNITNSVQPATVTFTAGTTQTVSNFGLSGSAGNLITINSDTPGSQFTLSSSSGSISAQYLSIQDSNATGGANWFANNSVKGGNTTGWIFNNGNGFAAMFF